MPRASLVIPTRNRAPALARTLASLLGQTEPDFEVVVVDDGSDDDTPAIAKHYAGRLDLRYLRRAHRGIAAARSAAMRAARADLLIQTDDDRIAGPTYIAEHVAAHTGPTPRVVAGTQRGLLAAWSAAAELPATAVAQLLAREPALAGHFAQPEAELVSPAMLVDDLAGTIARFEVDEPWWQHYAAPVIAARGPDLDGFAFPWSLASGGNTSVPRDLAEQLGFLDESFVGWGLEDTDFHYRLVAAGAQVHAFAAGATSYHQLHRRGPALVREWTVNARRLLDKHASIALCLYIAAIRRVSPIEEASAAANQIADAHPAAIAELIRVHRELIRAG